MLRRRMRLDSILLLFLHQWSRSAQILGICLFGLSVDERPFRRGFCKKLQVVYEIFEHRRKLSFDLDHPDR